MKPAETFQGRKCRDCRKQYYREWQKRSKEHLREYRKKYWSQKDSDRATTWNRNHPDRRRKHALNYYYRLQDEAMMAYGGYKCVCCGETEPLFLTLDHINNDGKEHRKEVKNWAGAGMYKWAKDHGYPPIFQVLCFNCNLGKRRNHGICPHQET